MKAAVSSDFYSPQDVFAPVESRNASRVPSRTGACRCPSYPERQLRVSAAPSLGGARRQLATVHGKMLPPDQTQLRGHEQDITKELRDLAIEFGNGRGYRREMRSRGVSVVFLHPQRLAVVPRPDA